MAKKKDKVNIVIEKELEEREETLMVKSIYDKLADYMKDHPEFSFMMVSYNNKDKVGTSFLLGDEEDISKECASLMLYNKDQGISRTFNKVFTRLFNYEKVNSICVGYSSSILQPARNLKGKA